MKYVIVGAGPAGVIAAETLRKADPEGTVTLIGDEPEPPYSRMAIPYMLVENIQEDGTYLRKTPNYFDDQNIEVIRQRVTKVDSTGKKVTLADGSEKGYDKLLIATGSRPIRPPVPGMDLPGVHTCWTLADAREILKLARPDAKVLLIGAGFIGCIVLEALAARKVDLTVVEMGDRMVPRMMNQTAGNLIKQWCESKNVRVLTSTQVTGITENKPAAAPAPSPAPAAADSTSQSSDGFFQNLLNIIGLGSKPPVTAAPTPAPQPQATATAGSSLKVTLNNGEELEADLVISAAGVQPNLELAKDAGIETDNGILVNRHLRSSNPDIYAAGDICQGWDFSTSEFEVHAIQPTASEHGRIAALNMAGIVTEYQGSLNMNVLDTLGLISSSFGQWMGVEGGDSAEASDPERFRYINLEFKDDVLVGATSLGLTQHVGVLRGLIQGKVPLGPWKAKLKQDPHRIMEAYLAKNYTAQHH